jgi:hypothetical protein
LRSNIVASNDRRHAGCAARLYEMAIDKRYGLRAEAAIDVIAFADADVDTPVSSG